LDLGRSNQATAQAFKLSSSAPTSVSYSSPAGVQGQC